MLQLVAGLHTIGLSVPSAPIAKAETEFVGLLLVAYRKRPEGVTASPKVLPPVAQFDGGLHATGETAPPAPIAKIDTPPGLPVAT